MIAQTVTTRVVFFLFWLSLLLVFPAGHLLAAWGVPEQVGTNRNLEGFPDSFYSFVGSPHAVMGDTGDGLGIWGEWNNISDPYVIPSVFANSYEESAWGSEQEILPFSGYLGQLVSTATGRALVLSDGYCDPRSPCEYIITRAYAPATGWTQVRVLSSTEGPYSLSGFSADMNNAGHGIYTVIQEDVLGPEVFVRHYDPVTEWGNEINLSPGTFDPVGEIEKSGIKLAMNERGQAIVVWLEEAAADSNIFDVRVSRYEPSAGWSTSEIIDSSLTSAVGSPDVVIDEQGNAIVIWSEAIADNSDEVRIYANRYESGSWQGAGLVVWKANVHRNIQLLADRQGNAWLHWGTFLLDGSNRENVKRYVSGSGWSSSPFPLWVNQVNAISDDMQLVTDGQGNAVVVWLEFDGALQTRRFDVQQSRWQYPIILRPGTGLSLQYDAGFNLAANDSGNVFVGYLQADVAAVAAFVKRYDGEGWSSSNWSQGQTRVDNSDAGVDTLPAIAVNSDGNALAMWVQDDDATVWVNRYQAEVAADVITFESIVAGNYAELLIGDYQFIADHGSVLVYDDSMTTSASAAWADTLRLSRVDGQSFDLNSFDYNGRWVGVDGLLEVMGVRQDGSIVESKIAYDASGWKTKDQNWFDLVEVAFYSSDGRVQLDNIKLEETRQSGTVLDFTSQLSGVYQQLTEKNYSVTGYADRDFAVFELANNKAVSPAWGNAVVLAGNQLINNGKFNLGEIEVANYWDNSLPASLVVEGIRADGGVVNETIPFQTTAWKRISLNWTDLRSVMFFSIGGRVLLDNIAVTP